MSAGPLLWNPTVQFGCMLKATRRSVHRSVIRKRSPNSPSSSHGGAAGSPLDDAACTLRQRTAVHCTQSIHTVDRLHTGEHRTEWDSQSGTHRVEPTHTQAQWRDGSAASNIRCLTRSRGEEIFLNPSNLGSAVPSLFQVRSVCE